MDPNWDYQPGQAGIIGKDHLVLCLTEVMKWCKIQLVSYDKVKEITMQVQDEKPALIQAQLVDELRTYRWI